MASNRILEEGSSLRAISKLEQADLPYAATLLVYVVLERCLKFYMLENRKDWEIFKIRKPYSGKKCDFYVCDYGLFIKNFLTKQNCTLENLEKDYEKGTKYADHRNKVFHSNFDIKE